MTLEAWVKPTSITSDWRTVVLKERPSGLAYALYATDGASRPPVGYITTGGADKAAIGTSNLSLNTWTHLATTYNGSSLHLYVNGTLVRTLTTSGNVVIS
ncbi:MAG: Mo-co oxidoreductase dimerization domain-containing protein, partial [Gammaproteobacteria bacterium]